MSFGGDSGDDTATKTYEESKTRRDEAVTMGNEQLTKFQNYLDDYFKAYIDPALKMVNEATKQGVDRNAALLQAQEKLAKDREAFYQTTGKPAIKDYIQKAMNFNTKGYQEEQSRLALGDVNSQFALKAQATERDLGARGINAGSAAALAASGKDDIERAKAAASATARARLIAQQTGLAAGADAARVGMGLKDDSAQIRRDMTGTIGQGVAIPQAGAGLALDAGKFRTPGYAAGIDLANQRYTTESGLINSSMQTKQKADAAEDEGWGNLIGTGLGIASKVFFPRPV